ncbi:hypothetical protein ACLESO_24390 [Pyxidicoccus sp. 3LG]
MKKFKLKDLMVAVIPREEETEAACAAPTCGPFGQTCFMQTCPLNTCANNTCRQGTCIGFVTCFGGTNCPAFTCLDFSQCLNRTCRFVTRGPTLEIEAASDDDLAQLRKELQVALKEVDSRTRQAEARQQPRTVEEVEELEQRLRDALNELAAQKKSLEHK